MEKYQWTNKNVIQSLVIRCELINDIATGSQTAVEESMRVASNKLHKDDNPWGIVSCNFGLKTVILPMKQAETGAKDQNNSSNSSASSLE